MIEETGTSGYGSTDEVPAMEVSNSHGSVRRSRDATISDVTSSGHRNGTGKRRRVDSEDQKNVYHLQYQPRRDVDVNFQENVVSTAVFRTSDHVSSFMCSINDNSATDLKTECLPETEIFISSNDGFREISKSSVICLESKEMDSLSSSTPEKKKKVAAPNEVTSRRKPSPAVVQIPSAAELEEFFSKAEKHEQKRFAEKYNYDIVKDVPMEGRYQWIPLKQ